MLTSESLQNNKWKLKNFDERKCLFLSQKFKIPYLLAKLLSLRNINEENLKNYIEPDIITNFPNPFLLTDMEKAVFRVIESLKNNEKIGIVADYDVDGASAASILYKFLNNFTSNITLKIPDRLTEGYGPNNRIMDEMLNENINLVFTLDCGTTSTNIIDQKKYKKIDVIVIDHHLSESLLPKVYAIINPNRYDENSGFDQMAAVGITFLFLMALRKKLREIKFFKTKKEPNLINYLDLVALGTVCDVVKLTDYNRTFVKVGLDLIKKRKHLGIKQIIDNSNIYNTPTSLDLGFIIGPQLNAASRLDDSSLPYKLLITNDKIKIEKICKKLILLNEKRKLIEKNVFDQALVQAENQKKSNYIFVYGDNWHIGVLGIVASKLISIFYKPTIVVSIDNKIGIGSARSIKNIDLGKLIMNAKNEKILIRGGGHSMAAGLQISNKKINDFKQYLDISLNKIDLSFFKKIDYFDSYLSVNELNNNFLDIIEKLEPYGNGNPEPIFLINDINIDSIKIIKDTHILAFFENEIGLKLKAICFNCLNTNLGEHLINFRSNKFIFVCSVQKDNYGQVIRPQLVIKDAIINN